MLIRQLITGIILDDNLNTYTFERYRYARIICT